MSDLHTTMHALRALDADRTPPNLHTYSLPVETSAPPSEDEAQCYACLAPATQEIKDRSGWLRVCDRCARLEE